MNNCQSAAKQPSLWHGRLAREARPYGGRIMGGAPMPPASAFAAAPRLVIAALVLLGASLSVRAQDKATMVKWSGKDVDGAALSVPAADQPTVLLFIRADQPQSVEAMKAAKATLESIKPVQAIAILSGQQDVGGVKKLADGGQWPGRIVLDPDYAASGQLGIHAWPTTVVVRSTGEQVAHLPGLSKSYALELDAYLSFAAGKIDKVALQQKLADHNLVTDSPEQMAARHLQVAQRLLEKDQVDQARAELGEGLKLQPHSAPLQLALGRVLLIQGQPAEAMKIAEQLDQTAVPAWQINLLRGRVLIAQGKWDQAKSILLESLKLNPNPGEVHYELGVVYQQQADWQHAAESFRAAFESKAPGHRIVTTQP